MDVIEKNVELPIEIRAGQLVLIPSAGAYTTSYASEFNGFPIPEVVII
jgi:ornithine decarboxylase